MPIQLFICLKHLYRFYLHTIHILCMYDQCVCKMFEFGKYGFCFISNCLYSRLLKYSKLGAVKDSCVYVNEKVCSVTLQKLV